MVNILTEKISLYISDIISENKIKVKEFLNNNYLDAMSLV